MKVLAYTQGENIPSARFRVRQYIARLQNDYDINVLERAARHGAYPPPGRLRRGFWLARTAADAARRVMPSGQYDLCWLQRELISTLDTFERFIAPPVIFDVDDAIFLLRKNHFAGRIAARSAAVICGNIFIADYFRRFNKRIYVLPTAVDTARFFPARHLVEKPVIGWIGGSSGLPFLYGIEKALRTVLELRPDASLSVVCDQRPDLRSLPPDRVKYEQWSADKEAGALRRLTIGLMPLPDTAWSKGKCSYKMLLYMAAGLPVVVSPVGMNSEVLSQGRCGFAAGSDTEWVEALLHLLDRPIEAQDMGRTGRRLAEQHYSLDVLTPRLAGIIREYA